VTLARVTRRVGTELRYSGLSAWRALVDLLFSEDLTYAASIAYYALLSLFPFLLLLVSILSTISASDSARVEVLTFVFRYFPTRLDFVAEQFDSLQASRFRVGLAGGFSLLWASLGVFGAVTSAVNAAWGVEKQRSFLKHRLVSFLMLVAAGGFLMLALLLASFAEVASASWFGMVLARYNWIMAFQTWAARYVSIVLLILGVGLVFYFIPNAKTRLRDVWVGAIVTGLLWRGAFSGFAWYIASNQRLALIHGSIFAVVVFLLWIYVSAVILMFGVEFTASYARLRRRRTEEMPAAATPRT
jgi:membrane protein